MIDAYMNWSGGKDSAMTLLRIRGRQDLHIHTLLTSINADVGRISMHGVRRKLLEAQAAAIGMPLQTIELPSEPDMEIYENAMRQEVDKLQKVGCTHALFGDIFLEDLRRYREERLAAQGIRCLFPLWKIPTVQLMEEFITAGFRAIIVCVDQRHLDKSFCGRMLDRSFLEDLPDGVDPCGENGEYHSFVFDGPIFHHPVAFEKGEIVQKEYKGPEGPVKFYFCDLYN